MTATDASRQRPTVTWTHMIAMAGILVTGFGGTLTFVWSQHASHPHQGAVTQGEMKQFEKRIDAQHQNQSRRFDRLESSMQEILRRLPK